MGRKGKEEGVRERKGKRKEEKLEGEWGGKGRGGEDKKGMGRRGEERRWLG